MRQLLSVVLASGWLATSATSAAVTRLTWRQVANAAAQGSANFPGQSGNTLYTFDLILQGDAGQRINGVNMGDSFFPNAAPFALHTNAAVGNHLLGGNVRSSAFEGFFPDIAFDTFVALGYTIPGPAISFAGGTDLSGAGGVLRATWFTTDNAVLDGNGEMRILRATVGLPSDFDPFTPPFPYYLGTHHLPGFSPISSLEVGLPAGQLVTMVIPNALGPIPPTPGTTALLGIAGAAGLRRRR